MKKKSTSLKAGEVLGNSFGSAHKPQVTFAFDCSARWQATVWLKAQRPLGHPEVVAMNF